MVGSVENATNSLIKNIPLETLSQFSFTNNFRNYKKTSKGQISEGNERAIS